MKNERTAALKGIRVIEWATALQGPVVGLMLGDLGAEVIKIEEPGGHHSRTTGAFSAHRRDMSKEQLIGFVTVNRNKKSITIDLHKEKGREIVHKLVARSDVFITNYSKSIAAKWNLDYKTLSRLHPKLIYATASGLGPKMSEKPYYDSMVQARSGLMMGFGDRDAPPSMIVGSDIDVLGGTVCTLGIVTALLARDRLDIGQELDSSLLSSAIWFQLSAITGSLGRGRNLPKHSRTKAEPLLTHYRCKDDKWILMFEGSDDYWHQFCTVVGAEYLENDPRFCNRQARREHRQECISILDGIFATKDRSEWLTIFKNQGVGFLYEAVQDPLDLPNDPAVTDHEYLLNAEHPILGQVKLVSFPVKFSKTPATVSNTGPELGEQTDEVLSEIGGYSADEICEFREQGVV